PWESFRYQARNRRVLDGRRYRLDHGPLVQRVRSPFQWHHFHHVRTNTPLPAWGTLVVNCPEIRGDYFVLRPDRDSYLHEVGTRDPGAVRPELTAHYRVGGRTD